MIKTLASSLLFTSLLGFNATLAMAEQWQITAGQLAYQTQEINWQSGDNNQCADCAIQKQDQNTNSGQVISYKLIEGDNLRAIKVAGNKSWISIPTDNAPVKLALLHKKDGSLMVRTPRGSFEHLELHQTNYLEVQGQQYAVWLNGYNPASRNWRYDDAHDTPTIDYTLLAL